QAIGQQLHATSPTRGWGKLKEAWSRICQQPQDVRVLGIPWDSHFAQVMVKADYDLKKLVDGTDPIEIAGLQSLTGMTMERMRGDLLQHVALSVPAASQHRFWFCPDDDLYEKDRGVIIVNQNR